MGEQLPVWMAGNGPPGPPSVVPFSGTVHRVMGGLLPRVTPNLGCSKELGLLCSSPSWTRRQSKGCKVEKNWSPESRLLGGTELGMTKDALADGPYSLLQ